MSLFSDLPAPVKEDARPSKPGKDKEEETLHAQLAKLREQQDAEASGDEDVDEQAEEQGDEEEDEEELAAEAPMEEPQQDLRRRPRPRDEDIEEPEPARQRGHATEGHAAGPRMEPAPPTREAKRVRIHDAVVTEVHEPRAAARRASPPPAGSAGDEVCAALQRLAGHLGNPAKFAKACPLLRKLLDGGGLTRASHQPDLFRAIRAAFTEPGSTCVEPTLRREYMKLIASIAAKPELFGRPEKAHLDIYRVVGHVQNELFTDDGFTFNKALGRVKEVLEELEEATPEDDETLAQLYSRGQGNPWVAPGSAHDADERQYLENVQRIKDEHARRVKAWEEQEEQQRRSDQQQAQAPQQQGEEEGEVAATEADPFGLDQLLAKEVKQKQRPDRGRRPPPPAEPALPPPPPPSTSAWSPRETACMRREALMTCVSTAVGFHKNAWACIGVELLIEQCHENKARFCKSHQPAVEELMAWVRHQRALRKQGPSAKEVNRDSTSFERARSEWSKVAVSARGKVGGGGDAKANNWLG